MSHHDQTLRQIFAHPVSMNIRWKDVVHLIESLGGRAEPSQGGRERFVLNGQDRVFHVPHSKDIESRDEVLQIRRFLEAAGVRPSSTAPGDAHPR